MITKADFLLRDYDYATKIVLEVEELTIKIEKNTDVQLQYQSCKDEIDFLAQNTVMSIAGPETKEDFRGIAIDIKNLLSMALGKRITFDQQNYFTDDGTEELETKEMARSLNEGQQIVPDFQLGKFLNDTLPVWRQFSKETKDQFFVVTDYLNQTKHDFIEDRILRAVQGWECAAGFWEPEVPLNPQMSQLKSKLTETLKIWKRESNYIDTNGELGSRLTLALDQEKLITRLENLLTNSGLKSDVLSLDLRKLKGWRDMVAHKGRINAKGADVVHDLIVGVSALQLIILQRIGYKGLVKGEANGWRTIKPMSDYFN